jgi:hypothetical protein
MTFVRIRMWSLIHELCDLNLIIFYELIAGASLCDELGVHSSYWRR